MEFGLFIQAYNPEFRRGGDPVEAEHRVFMNEIAAVEAAGGRVLSVQPIRQSLEDYFIKEMGGEPQRGSWEGED